MASDWVNQQWNKYKEATRGGFGTIHLGSSSEGPGMPTYFEGHKLPDMSAMGGMKDLANRLSGGTTRQPYTDDGTDETKLANEYYSGKAERGESLSMYTNRRKVELDAERARSRFEDIVNPGSEWNKSMEQSIARINKPDQYEDSLLYNAMGMGSKSSSLLAQYAIKDKTAKAGEKTYNQFAQFRGQAEGTAASYLGQATGANMGIYKVMNDTQMQIRALQAQKEIEENQRSSQLFSSIFNTVAGGAITLAAPWLAPAVIPAMTAIGSLGNSSSSNPLSSNYQNNMFTPSYGMQNEFGR